MEKRTKEQIEKSIKTLQENIEQETDTAKLDYYETQLGITLRELKNINN